MYQFKYILGINYFVPMIHAIILSKKVLNLYRLKLHLNNVAQFESIYKDEQDT